MKKLVLLLLLLPILLLGLVLMVPLFAVTGLLGGGGGSPPPADMGTGQFSPEVERYRDIVTIQAEEAGIGGFVNLVLAVMQVESGGRGLDVMQCSECPLNTQYPNRPNAITDVTYSIRIGTQYLKNCLTAAGAEEPDDIDRISLALQGYNFGNGYISWALSHYGGYSLENAKEFSRMMAQKLGWQAYGSPVYVPAVLKFYRMKGAGRFGYPLREGTYTISSGFGMRTNPFTGQLTGHKGIDFAANTGVPIYASDGGTVIYAGYDVPPYYGYGKAVVIQHDTTYVTLYAHCSELLVREGETVSAGQLIAKVGSTGNSTGPHCHYEIRENGVPVDPQPILDWVLENPDDPVYH